MRMTRGRDWGIDLFLWLAPLAGIGVSVGNLLARRTAQPLDPLPTTQLFDVPRPGWLIGLGTALLLPLIVSLLTRRWLGFLAGTCLMLLIAAVTAWAASHRASGYAVLLRVSGPPGNATLRGTGLTSQGGGISLAWMGGGAPDMVEGVRKSYLAAGKEQSLSFRADRAESQYPSRGNIFEAMPALWRGLGFAVTVHPREVERQSQFDIPFALTLPYWFLCVIAAPLPLIWTLRFRRRRRLARRSALGLCMSCGYDLRATPDATGALLPICPECGAAEK